MSPSRGLCAFGAALHHADLDAVAEMRPRRVAVGTERIGACTGDDVGNGQQDLGLCAMNDRDWCRELASTVKAAQHLVVPMVEGSEVAVAGVSGFKGCFGDAEACEIR